jgi:hypothetical protein
MIAVRVLVRRVGPNTGPRLLNTLHAKISLSRGPRHPGRNGEIEYVRRCVKLEKVEEAGIRSENTYGTVYRGKSAIFGDFCWYDPAVYRALFDASVNTFPERH